MQNMKTLHFHGMKEAPNIFLKIRGIKNLYNTKSEQDICPCKAAPTSLEFYGAFACKGARHRAGCVGLLAWFELVGLAGLVRVGWAGRIGRVGRVGWGIA